MSFLLANPNSSFFRTQKQVLPNGGKKKKRPYYKLVGPKTFYSVGQASHAFCHRVARFAAEVMKQVGRKWRPGRDRLGRSCALRAMYHQEQERQELLRGNHPSPYMNVIIRPSLPPEVYYTCEGKKRDVFTLPRAA